VAINRQVASAMLRNLGVEVDVAVDGREALDILDMHLDDAPYAAILMDCQMPQLDGFETTAAIRQREAGQRTVPIIAMTAGAMRGDRDRCLAAGMDDYLAKPLRFEALEQALRRWLGPFAVPSGSPSQPAVRVQALPASMDWAILADLGRQLDWAGRGDGSALAGMIAEFHVEAASRIGALRQAAEANDTPGVRKTAHALRGPAGSLGALAVESLAAQLERLAGGSSLEGAEALIDALYSAVERASAALDQWQARPAPEARCAS
jgi:CheY-like chemotaxis protein